MTPQSTKIIDTCPRCGGHEFKIPEFECVKCHWQDPYAKSVCCQKCIRWEVIEVKTKHSIGSYNEPYCSKPSCECHRQYNTSLVDQSKLSNTPPSEDGFDKEFNSMWWHEIESPEEIDNLNKENFRKFIREQIAQALQAERTRIRERVKGMKRPEEDLIGTDSEMGYEKALSDIEEILENDTLK